MNRLLVTGAGGFIGTAVLESLARGEHEIHAVSSRRRASAAGVTWHVADLLAPDAAEDLVATVRPELLLHLAWYAEHGRFWTSIENVRWVEATLRLLRAFARHGGRRATVAGTCAEYEWSPQGSVLSERRTRLRPATLYGVSKNATRSVAEALAEQAAFELAWGRAFFVYGPGEVETRLVPSVIRALLEQRPALVTEGSQVRDFLHVDDVAGAFVALLDSDVRGAVNIGSGAGVAVREVIEAIGAIAGRLDLIEFGAIASRVDEPVELIADVGRLRDEVGFRARTGLLDGLEKTVGWWRGQLSGVSAETG